MHPVFKQQKELMQQALKKIEERETIERLITPFDPIISKIMVDELKNQYITIMQTLLTNMLEVSGQMKVA